MKTTIKDITNGLRVDITNYSAKQCYELLDKEANAGGYMQEIAWAPCIYGVEAKLYYGTGTHTFYKITRRTTALLSI